ncbi:MAG: hypothetical protein ASARMPRED_006770 [Alectoria sarmentosa]|nr:MAG: hypothetical protein ASARMPRED_006770 [Alectoria sarmentosa]
MSQPHVSEVDVLIIGAGPAGLMAALWMSRCGIKTRVIDRREEHVRVGQADGIQSRSLELFDSFDIVDKIWKESCHMVEMSMWNPGDDGVLRRASRMSNTIPGISRFSQGVLLAQHRIEGVFLESLAEYSNVEVQRSVQPISITYNLSQVENQSAYPVTIRIAQIGPERSPYPIEKPTSNGAAEIDGERKRRRLNSVDEEPAAEEVIAAKFVISCDGAHSWTRSQLGFQMEGEQSEYIWGVLDVIPITNFPDIRTRCAIHTASAGSIMLIPREDRLVRIYCQLSEVKPGSDGRFDRSSIKPDMILKAAQKIMSPYELEYKHCDWWTTYQIGQRVGTRFSAHDRIFLAGDAIHTHSPKAGQGMNVSMQDSYNLGWKLALVIKGIAIPSILETYESERRRVAKELIEFDQRFSRLWSKPPAKDSADEGGVLMKDFQHAFQKQRLFSSGFAVDYGPSILTAKDGIVHRREKTNGAGCGPKTQDCEFQIKSQQHLATNIPLGQRFPSFRVINHCDARSWHFGKLLKADGLFHIVLFAGDVSKTEQMQRIYGFTDALTNMATPLVQHRINSGSEKARCHVADVLTIHSAPRQQVEYLDFPELLRPFDEELGWDYDRIFVDEESYYEGHGNAYEGYGIDKVRGCVVIVRPDQHVAWIGGLEDVDSLETYFANFLVAS